MILCLLSESVLFTFRITWFDLPLEPRAFVYMYCICAFFLNLCHLSLESHDFILVFIFRIHVVLTQFHTATKLLRNVRQISF